MARAALIFGILLILLGLVGYTTTGRTSLTALIPAGFGLLILVCGLVGRRESLRPHAMHAGALLALIGLAGTIRAPFQLLGKGAAEGAAGAAVLSRTAMAVLCLAYIALSVRSFIAARKARSGAA